MNYIAKSTTDGINFTLLGKINGLGNSSQEKRYNFIDESSLLGTNYYQLVQYDFDGKKTVLGVKSVKVTLVNNWLVYPNPTNGLVNLSFDTNSFQKLELIDITGKIMRTRTIGTLESTINFDISELSSGIYTIRLVGQGTLITRQIFKQ